MEEHYRADLQCRRRKSTESLRELAQDIRRLVMLSYPGDQSPISENLAKEHFIVALEDPELELKIREREPCTLDSALRVAQRFEVFRSAIRQCKQHMSRQVTEDTWVDTSSDMVAEVGQAVTKSNVQQHKQPEPKPHGCGTSTKAINKREINYCITRKELLAVVYALKHFKQYLLRRHFKVRTDHAPLTWLKLTPEPIGQQARWLEIMQNYSFDVIHRPGVSHLVQGDLVH